MNQNFGRRMDLDFSILTKMVTGKSCQDYIKAKNEDKFFYKELSHKLIKHSHTDLWAPLMCQLSARDT